MPLIVTAQTALLSLLTPEPLLDHWLFQEGPGVVQEEEASTSNKLRERNDRGRRGGGGQYQEGEEDKDTEHLWLWQSNHQAELEQVHA